jgi:hypothetical protein
VLRLDAIAVLGYQPIGTGMTERLHTAPRPIHGLVGSHDPPDGGFVEHEQARARHFTLRGRLGFGA